jgi:NAD(P)-dependent dehydrogenase (short-subunit alcohol dehydrogenase family)
LTERPSPPSQIPTPGLGILKDKVIFLTGAAGALGRVAATALARHGATIVLSDKDLAPLEAVYDQIIEGNGPQPAIYPMDLARATAQDYEEMARVIEREFGVLDGLLHNAASFAVLGPISNIDPEDWARVINVNLSACFLLTRALIGLLDNSTDGSIVFTSDSSARTGSAYWGCYGVSKIAMEGFAAIVADEMEAAGRVRVNTLIPGPVASPLRNKAFPAEDPGRQLSAESLERLYIYLFGPASRGQHGQTFHANNYSG